MIGPHAKITYRVLTTNSKCVGKDHSDQNEYFTYLAKWSDNQTTGKLRDRIKD